MIYLIVFVLAAAAGGAAYYWRVALIGYRTMAWNGFVTALPLILYALDKLQAIDLTPYLTPGLAASLGIILGVVGMALRMITVGPVGAKGDEEPAPQTKAGD